MASATKVDSDGIIDWKTFDPKNLRLNPAVTRGGGRSSIRLGYRYKDSEIPFIVQTPVMRSPFGIQRGAFDQNKIKNDVSFGNDLQVVFQKDYVEGSSGKGPSAIEGFQIVDP